MYMMPFLPVKRKLNNTREYTEKFKNFYLTEREKIVIIITNSPYFQFSLILYSFNTYLISTYYISGSILCCESDIASVYSRH